MVRRETFKVEYITTILKGTVGVVGVSYYMNTKCTYEIKYPVVSKQEPI